MIRKKALEIASAHNISQPIIELYDTIIGLPGQGPNIKITLPEVDSSSEGFVLFPHLQGVNDAYRYCIIGQAFAENGYTPLFVICDDSHLFPTENQSSIELRKYKVKNMIDKFGFEYKYISDYRNKIAVEGDPNDEVTQKISKRKLKEFAKGSTRKKLKKYNVESEDERKLMDQYYRGGIILSQIFEQMFDFYDIHTVISHDPKYNWGGIPLYIANKKNVPAYSSTLGWKNKSIVLSNIGERNSLPHYEDKQLVGEILHHSLSPEQEKRVDQIMQNRASGESDARIDYASGGSCTFEISSDRFSVGVFTNLLWDANIESADGIFTDVFEWLEATIEHFSNRDEVELIIKPHPAEHIRGTNESVYTWVKEKYNELPGNVNLLKTDTDVNTYEMIDDIDAGIVFNSSVGFEMPYFETPVITVAEAPYGGQDIVYEPSTQEDYFEMCCEPNDFKITKTMIQRARRYIYFLFEIKHLQFPFIDSKDGEYHLLDVNERIFNDNMNVLNQIIDNSLSGNPILSPEAEKVCSLSTI
jgi:hypothetical protein